MTHRNDIDEALSKAAVAELLGVTIRTVERYIASGELTAVKVGKQPPRVLRRSVDEFLTPVIVPAPKRAS